MQEAVEKIMFVDVDDTFVRSFGTKRMPIPHVIAFIKTAFEAGVVLYCWSSGGAEYAQASAEEFGVVDCFVGFLPKPQYVLDDLLVEEWRNLRQIDPNGLRGTSVGELFD